MLATVRLALVQYLDDNRHYDSSRGAMIAKLDKVLDVAAAVRGELRFGRAKTSYHATQSGSETPINCVQGLVPAVQVHEGLGIPQNSTRRQMVLLAQVQKRGSVEMQKLNAAAEVLTLPLFTPNRGVEQRITPKACYGAEFLLTRPDYQVRVAEIQVRWFRTVLGLDCPGVWLFDELH